MKNFFLTLNSFFIFYNKLLFAEYRLEPVNCTLKKQSNCGAYLYNSSTGATYFCDSTKCTEIIASFRRGKCSCRSDGKTKKSKIPKKPKKKKSKIPKFKKEKIRIIYYCFFDSEIVISIADLISLQKAMSSPRKVPLIKLWLITPFCFMKFM